MRGTCNIQCVQHPHLPRALTLLRVLLQVLEAMDFYEVLGVAWNDSNPKALKSARKSRALAVHPDKAGGGAGADLAASRVNAAFDTLNCARARAEYDAWLANQF